MPDASAHPLFQTYPIAGTVPLSIGEAPTPYHVYAGHAIFIGGTLRRDRAEELLGHADLRLLPTSAPDRCLAALWVCDFFQASHGPHQEVQFSLLVSRQPQPALGNHPYSVIQAIVDGGESLGMLCHGLWNDSDLVLAYNREHLHLNALPMQGELRLGFSGQPASFAYTTADGQPLVSGVVRRPQSTSGDDAWGLLRNLGVTRTLRIGRMNELRALVISPPHMTDGALLAARTVVVNDRQTLHRFDPRAEHLEVSLEPYRSLDFQPQLVEHMLGFHFVYLDPQPWG